MRHENQSKRERLQARVFQNSKCAVSGAPLELPAVHFLCGHSCNLRSLGENERECPLCAPHFRTILDIRRSLKASATEQVKLLIRHCFVTFQSHSGFATIGLSCTVQASDTRKHLTSNMLKL